MSELTGNIAQPGIEASTMANAEPAAATDTAIVLRFLVLSVAHLFVGTVQGVVQTFPDVAQWIREAGPAGHLIDPLAHAHINLVGGVTMAIMGIFYYLLPRLLKRPVFSSVLSNASFWFSTLGVLGFFSSLVYLGIVEGNMIHSGMTYGQALEAVGPVHHLLIVSTAFVMGFGYWIFIANILLTIFNRQGGQRHAPTA